MSILDKKGFEYINQQIDTRNRIYELYEKFYLGIQYDDVAVRRAYALYAGVQEFYTLISRAVDVDVQLVPGKWKVKPVEAQPAVNKILEWSNWRTQGNLYVHYGALFGDVYLLVNDNPPHPVIQPVSPMSTYLDEKRGLIVRNIPNEDGDLEEFAWLYTDEYIQIYKNGRLKSTKKHDLGFIPMVYCKNKDVGGNMGLNSFHNVIDQINAVNEMASILQDAILRSINPIKVVSSAQPADIQAGPDQTWHLPEGATFDLVSGMVDVAGILSFVQDIKREVEQALPEFIFDSLRAPGLERPNSADALRIYGQELNTKIDRMRDSYDRALEQAVNLAVLAARQMDLRPGEVPDNWHFDEDRPVLKLDYPTQGREEEIQNDRGTEV